MCGGKIRLAVRRRPVLPASSSKSPGTFLIGILLSSTSRGFHERPPPQATSPGTNAPTISDWAGMSRTASGGARSALRRSDKLVAVDRGAHSHSLFAFQRIYADDPPAAAEL